MPGIEGVIGLQSGGALPSHRRTRAAAAVFPRARGEETARPACDRRSACDLREAGPMAKSGAQLTGLVPPLTVLTLESSFLFRNIHLFRQENSRKHRALGGVCGRRAQCERDRLRAAVHTSHSAVTRSAEPAEAPASIPRLPLRLVGTAARLSATGTRAEPASARCGSSAQL